MSVKEVADKMPKYSILMYPISNSGSIHSTEIHNLMGTDFAFVKIIKFDSSRGQIFVDSYTEPIMYYSTYDTNSSLKWIMIGKEKWKNITLQSGWANYIVSYDLASYRKENGRVFLRGLVKDGKTKSILGVLPEGYRPKLTKNFITPVRSYDDTSATYGRLIEFLRVNISPDGGIVVLPYANENVTISYLSLDNINFEVD